MKNLSSKNHVKRFAFSVLRNIPGSLGRRFETSWYWADRALRHKVTKDNFQKSLLELNRDSVCVDLGANVGDVSALLADRAGHVHSFEPDPWAFEQLRLKLSHRTNVSLYNAAIGIKDGKIQLMRDPGFDSNKTIRSQGTSAFPSALWHNGTPESFEVRVVDFRRFLRELGTTVNLVKVDIEGSEVDLLEVLIDSPEVALIDEMFVETHEAQMPMLRGRLKILRRRISQISKPVIHLDWH